MGAQLKFGTVGATGGGFSHQPGSLHPTYGEFWHEPKWSWQQRSPKTRKDPLAWISRWSFGCRVGGADPSGGEYAPVGHDLQSVDLFEPYSQDGDGGQGRNFLRGTCVDSVGTIVANATVQAFVTATDLYVGADTSREDGTYGVGVEQAKATPHYLVAYKPGSPDIFGTTVNTLLPTNVDGT